MQDLNGIKQDWEAIIRIPFIGEEWLLKVIACMFLLMPAEKQGNGFRTSMRFSYNPGEPTVRPSSLPGFFSPLHRCICTMGPFNLSISPWSLPGNCDGVLTGAEALASFPSLHTLPHAAVLGFPRGPLQEPQQFDGGAH